LPAGLFGDAQSLAAERFEDAIGLQVAIGAGHGVRIDGDLQGQFTDRGDQVAGAESAVGDGEFDLADDLVVDR
jgi:hypothetical protein